MFGRVVSLVWASFERASERASELSVIQGLEYI